MEVSTESGNTPPVEDSNWLIPEDEVINGGVPKEGIPSIDDPQFQPTREIEYVDDHRLMWAFGLVILQKDILTK